MSNTLTLKQYLYSNTEEVCDGARLTADLPALYYIPAITREFLSLSSNDHKTGAIDLFFYTTRLLIYLGEQLTLPDIKYTRAYTYWTYYTEVADASRAMLYIHNNWLLTGKEFDTMQVIAQCKKIITAVAHYWVLGLELQVEELLYWAIHNNGKKFNILNPIKEIKKKGLHTKEQEGLKKKNVKKLILDSSMKNS